MVGFSVSCMVMPLSALSAALPLPAVSNTALASISISMELPSDVILFCDAWPNVTVTVEPDTDMASLAPGVTPSEFWPDTLTCRRSLCAVEFSASLKVAKSVPLPV